MSRLDELPPDQRAALDVLLRQRKSYAEVARMLGISDRAVHDRAHAALAVLAPAQARALSASQRDEIGDYLLGQSGVAGRLKARTYLNSSEDGRGWARAIAAELAPLAGNSLPDLSGSGPNGDRDAARSGADAAAPSSAPARSSRVGGAILLAVIAFAAVILVIVLSSGGSGHHSGTTTAGAGTSTHTTAGGPTVDARIALSSPDPHSRTFGVMEVVSEGSNRAFFIEAQHLPASRGFFYAIWLYNSPTSALGVSRAPAVGSTHRLAGGAALPSDAGDFREVLLTRETSTRPTQPGPVVLRGDFTLGG